MNWDDFLSAQQQQDYYASIERYLANEKQQGKTIYPADADRFSAFKFTPYEKVKVVILGQDPYHGPGQAHGLAFSVQDGVKPPPSLRNIYKELNSDLDLPIATCGELSCWAKQGVLLLNTCLTVEAGKAQSHSKIGWERLTDEVIKLLNQHPKPIVYLLWGAAAQRKEALIDMSKHAVLKAPHPSPLSAHRGFLGCRHFSKANEFLLSVGREPVDWCVV